MRLRELYAKGLASSPEPITLAIGSLPAIADLTRPTIEALGRCLEALLYPDQLGAAPLSDLAGQDDFEFGLVFRIGTTDLRLRRGISDASLELQLSAEGQFKTRAQGLEAVLQVLVTKLARPPWDRFRHLHLGGGPSKVEPIPTHDPLDAPNDSFAEWLQPTSLGIEVRDQADSSGLANTTSPRLPNPLDFVALASPVRRSPEEIARLRHEYQKALKVEALEDQINDLRRRLNELTPAVGQAFDPALQSIRQELEASPGDDVKDEDLAVLRDPEGRTQDFERRRTALDHSLEEVRERMRAGGSLVRNPLFVVGVSLTVICSVISIVGGPSLRAVALGNVAWLAGVLMSVLQHARARDEGRAQQQRVFALEEALEDLGEERHVHERELASARRRHGVQSHTELESIRAKRRQLLEAEERALEGHRAEQERGAASHSVERARVAAELARLDGARAQLGDCPLASFQIAQELRQLGVAPESTHELPAVGSVAGPVDSVSSVGSWTQRAAPPPPLRELAQELGLFGSDGLEPGARRLWGRMSAALLNRKVESPNIADDGGISLSDETGLVWATLTERERGLVAESAYLGLLLGGLGRSRPQPWPWAIRLDPFALYDDVEVDRLQRLYQRLAEHLQFVVLDSGRRGDSGR